MSVTQFKMLVSPRAHFSEVADSVVGDDDSDWDKLPPPSASPFAGIDVAGLTADLEAILPRCASWSDKLLMFGQEDGNRIGVDLDESKRIIISMTARVDSTKIDHQYLKRLCQFLRDRDWVMIAINSGQMIEPQFDELYTVVRNSWSRMIAEDPMTNLPLAAEDIKARTQGDPLKGFNDFDTPESIDSPS